MEIRDPANSARGLLIALFDEAVRVAHPSFCVPPWLPSLVTGERLLVIGAGKAAAAMAVAVEAHYAALGQLDQLDGLVTTRHGFSLPTRRLRVQEAGHPKPDAASEAAARQALTMARSAAANARVLVLLSGGASALWSAPAAPLTADDKRYLTAQLLASGAPIGAMNTVRRHISSIKGGRLADAARHTRLLTLAISDVPRDEPEAIGSGPTVADPTTLADARAVLSAFRIEAAASITRALCDPSNETLKSGDAALSRAHFEIVARPRASLEAAAARARAAGYTPIMLGDSVEGEARDVGRQQAQLALSARQRGERTAILSGGECTVTVVGDGAGGPNQEFALGLALALDGAPGITALAADTDGIDGGSGAATDPAGAIVTPDTLARARLCHIDARNMLANNNSSAFFAALGDLVRCGPTQTNVNDFRVILVDPA